MKNNLLPIFLHPFFIAVVITLVIINFIPDYFTKYKVDLVEKSGIGLTQRVYFEDLNGDHKSEKIVAQETWSGHASFIVYNESGDMIDQWNFKGDFPKGRKDLWFHDTDKNRLKEIYGITHKKDSAFLEIARPFTKDEFAVKTVYIDSVGEFDNSFQLFPGKKLFTSDLNSDGNEEILFALSSGYACYPRFAYKYNFQNDKITKSQHLVNPMYIDYIIDIDNSGSKEILFVNHSASNKIDSTLTKRSDYSSWFTVLDKDMNFFFEPIEFPSPFSSVQTLPIKSGQNEYNILCRINSRKENEFPDKLCLYSSKGELIKDHRLPKGEYVIYKSNNQDEFILLNRENGKVVFYNEALELLDNSISIEPKMLLFSVDIMQDGKNEWLVSNNNAKSTHDLKLYNENFQYPVEFQITTNSIDQLSFGLKRTGKNSKELYFQKGEDFFIYKYSKNPLYHFKYLIYLGVFLLVFGFVWLIRKGQLIQMEKSKAIEDEISELQIKTIKNQVDPHFVFNAVNTISEMMLTNDKLEADRFISKFSKLMRETLQKSDKISTTLQEEIDYVENYIQLQKIRFSNKFDFKIDKDPKIDYQTKVPKHVLYSYVENAIKHGLSGKTEGGLLKISAEQKNGNILLSVENNGGGIDKSKNTKRNSTGSGVKIMEEMYGLYQKLYNKKIKHKMTELIDEKGNKKGVRVEIMISK